jgi:hypothetical protein
VRAKLRNFFLSPSGDDDDVPELHNVVARGWLPHYFQLKSDLKKKKPEDLTDEEYQILDMMSEMECDLRISTKWIGHNLPSFADGGCCFRYVGERETADGETHEERRVVTVDMVDSSIETVHIVYRTNSNNNITKATFERDQRSEVAALTKAHDEYLGRIKVRLCCRPIPTPRGTLVFFSPTFHSKTQVREVINDGTIRNMIDIDKHDLEGPFNDYLSRLSIVEERKTNLFRREARRVAVESGFENEITVLTWEEFVLALNKDATRLLVDDDLDKVLKNFEDRSISFAGIAAISVAFSNLARLPPNKKPFVDFVNKEATKVFADDDDMRFLNKVRHIRRACLLDPGWTKHNMPAFERLTIHDGRASKTELYRNPAPTLVYNLILGEVDTQKAAELEELALSRLLESSAIATVAGRGAPGLEESHSTSPPTAQQQQQKTQLP